MRVDSEGHCGPGENGRDKSGVKRKRMSQYELVFAGWCIRIIGATGMFALTALIVLAGVDYVYKTGRHVTEFCAYLYQKRNKKK